MSDGTTAGTRLLATLCHPHCTEVVALGDGEDLAFFAERNPAYWDTTQRVVRTDGSVAGTFPVTGILSGYDDFSCPSAAMVGERLYFSVLTDRYVCALWSSDGTPTGTAPLDLGVGV